MKIRSIPALGASAFTLDFGVFPGTAFSSSTDGDPVEVTFAEETPTEVSMVSLLRLF
jgi:hypothetical protein